MSMETLMKKFEPVALEEYEFENRQNNKYINSVFGKIDHKIGTIGKKLGLFQSEGHLQDQNCQVILWWKNLEL